MKVGVYVVKIQHEDKVQGQDKFWYLHMQKRLVSKRERESH